MTDIQLKQLRTTYRQVGQGGPIVWVAGGGGRASDWESDYAAAFADSYRSTIFENRGTAGTECDVPLPWTVADMARDTAELIETVCDVPTVVVGHSLGALIMLQLVIDRPELVELGISLAGAARGDEGWIGDYMRAELSLRRNGGRLEPSFSATHYAAMMYPAKALQDRDLWAALRESLESEEVVANTESTMESQWEPCLGFNVVDQLPTITVPLEVVSFSEDVCAPPAYSAELASLAPNARLHELAGMGHASLFGHRPGEVSRFVRSLVDDHFARTHERASGGQVDKLAMPGRRKS